MEDKRKRLSLELSSDVQERLEAVALRKGVSMGQYCRSVIDEALSKDEADSQGPKLTIWDLIARRKALYGDKVFPGSSVDLISEAREERDRQMDSW